jgi:energy-coupling factor transporter ATP-binding protein EcfA2
MTNYNSSYYAEIGGDFKGIQGDISGGIINQYIITQKSGLEIIRQPLIKGSPYLGLRKFEVDDKDKFFGRDRWIIELTNYLAKENVLLLLGASGSGKSSLIQAGLIPKLKDQWGSQLFNFTFVPDVDPFESFYGCLLSKYKQSEAKLARTVKEDTLIQVVQSLKNDAQWLIFIDQFEEVFTRTPKTERDIFIKSLIQLIKNSDSSVKVIMTMRADFLDKLSPYPDLGKVHDSSSRMLTDMEDSDLRLAIAEPAARNGVIFEQGLIDTIITDFHQQAGSLPLLQYTLNLLWSKDDITDRVLNTKAYQELGGVTGALQQQANKIYDQFDETQRKLAEEIFLELIELVGKEAVSRRADKGIFERDETQREVLYQLIDNRLLVSKGEDGKATVEVAHEALLRSWKVLQDLIREKEEIIVLRNRLYADAKSWQDAQKASSELWSGSKLARIVEFKKEQVLPNLDGVTIAFIEASVAERDRQTKAEAERQKRELRQTRFTAGSIIILLIIVVFSFWQKQEFDSTINAVFLETDNDRLLNSLPQLYAKANEQAKPFLDLSGQTNWDDYYEKHKQEINIVFNYYRQVLRVSHKLKEGFKNDQKKIDEITGISNGAEKNLVQMIHTYRRPKLESQLQKKSFGKLKDKFNDEKLENRYTEGALKTTYEILQRESGAGADLNQNGLIETSEEANQMPCETLREIERLWQQYTSCSWLGKNESDPYLDTDCELNKVKPEFNTLAALIFIGMEESPLKRVRECVPNQKGASG